MSIKSLVVQDYAQLRLCSKAELVALHQHLTYSKSRNEIMHYAHESETDNILRVLGVANDLINSQIRKTKKNTTSKK